MSTVLFVGHGSPMNALSTNSWTASLNRLGQALPKPDSITVYSAHWETAQLEILKSPEPKTIYDFRGFPEELYNVHYHAPTHQAHTAHLQNKLNAKENSTWGFDHGVWSVLIHIFPDASIPLNVISIPRLNTFKDYFNLGRETAKALSEVNANTWLLGSGNIVHNLRALNYNKKDLGDTLAIQFDQRVRKALEANNVDSLLDMRLLEQEDFRFSHPTPDHYLPFVISLGAASVNSSATAETLYEGLDLGSLSMRSVLWK